MKITKKILAGITTLAVVTSVSVCSFVSCDENDPSENTHVSSGLIIQEQEANGISLCSTPISEEDYIAYNLPESTIEAKLVTYEILPEDSTFKNVEYSLSWSLDPVDDPCSDWHGFPERWAERAIVSDYVDVISVEKGFVVCLLDTTFSFPINMKLKVVGTDIEATLQIAYELRLSNAEDIFWENGELISRSFDYFFSDYVDVLPSDIYDMSYLFLEQCEFPSKLSFEFGVYGGTIWDEELNLEYDPYSKLGNYDFRVSLSDEWQHSLVLAKNQGFTLGPISDYVDIRLENYEFRSLASLIVAPCVEMELWPTIFSMTTEELLLEYNEVFQWYVFFTEDVSDSGHVPVFIVSVYDKNDKRYYESFVTFDYQSIGVRL